MLQNAAIWRTEWMTMSEVQPILQSCLELPAVRRVAWRRWRLHPLILEREVKSPRRGPRQPVSTDMIWQDSLNILAEVEA